MILSINGYTGAVQDYSDYLALVASAKESGYTSEIMTKEQLDAVLAEDKAASEAGFKKFLSAFMES